MQKNDESGNTGQRLVSVNVSELQHALALLKNTLGNSTFEQGFFLFTVKDGFLYITSNNNINSFKTKLELEPDVPFPDNMKFLVHSGVVSLMALIKDETVMIYPDLSSIKIHTNQGIYEFPSLSPVGFQEIPYAAMGLVLEIEASELAELTEIEYAAHQDLSDKLSAMSIHAGRKKTTFTCTNRYLIHQVQHQGLTTEEPGEWLINRKGIGLIKKLAEKSKGQMIKFALAKTVVVFELGNTQLFCKTISEVYPDTDTLLKPDLATVEIELKRTDLLIAAERLEILSSFGDIKYKVEFHLSDEHGLVMQINNSKTYEEITTSKFKGAILEPKGLNADHLVSSLKVLKCDDIRLLFDTGRNCGYIIPVKPSTKESLLNQIIFLNGYA